MVVVRQTWSHFPLVHMIHPLEFLEAWEVEVVLDLIWMKHVLLKALCHWYEHISQHPVKVVVQQSEGAIQN